MSEWNELHLRHDHRHKPHVETTASTTQQTTSISPPTSLSPFFNFSSYEVKEMDLASNETISGELAETAGSLYTIAVPIMCFFCLVTVVVNLVIVVAAHWCRRPMSPTLYFSISLALADAYSTLLVGLGLVLNSYLPNVYKINLPSDCFNLTFEVFRLGGILVSNVHLLALAINHWIGIVRPLHYAATMTRRTAWIVILTSWISPILLMFLIFSSTKDVGFLSTRCEHWEFLEERAFRGVFASLFFAPLFLMVLIYVHIFSIVRNHQNHRLRYQSSVQLKRNVKAIITTILILGTYMLGFLPATLFNIVVCKNCIVLINLVPHTVRVSWGILVNTLVILKALVDPVIYAARMADIQAALKRMRYDIGKRCCWGCVEPLPPELERGFSTKYARSQSQETKSLRASSVGSNSSWKRTSVNSPTTQLTTAFRQGYLVHQKTQQQKHFHKNGQTLLEMKEVRPIIKTSPA